MKGLLRRIFSRNGNEQRSFLSPIDYNLLFDHPVYDNRKLLQIRVGELFIESGLVTAGDPFFLNHMDPLNKEIPIGKHPVDICFVELDKSGRRIAAARLKFNNHRAVKWELAVTENDDTSSLEEDGYIGYPVNAGLGCFIDSSFIRSFDEVMTQHFESNGPSSNYYDDILASEFKLNALNPDDPNDIGDYNNHTPIKSSHKNITMFSSGIGDGNYPSYWGINEQGKICELITDFLIINPIE